MKFHKFSKAAAALLLALPCAASGQTPPKGRDPGHGYRIRPPTRKPLCISTRAPGQMTHGLA